MIRHLSLNRTHAGFFLICFQRTSADLCHKSANPALISGSDACACRVI